MRRMMRRRRRKRRRRRLSSIVGRMAFYDGEDYHIGEGGKGESIYM